MTDQPKRSRRKRRALIAFVLLLPVQYVFSVGPSVWLVENGFLPRHIHEAAYAPLAWVVGESGADIEMIRSWAGLWVR